MLRRWGNPHHELTCPMQLCNVAMDGAYGVDSDRRCKRCEHGECECSCDEIHADRRQRWLASVDEAWAQVFSAVGQGVMYLKPDEIKLLSAAEALLSMVQGMNGGYEGMKARKGKAIP